MKIRLSDVEYQACSSYTSIHPALDTAWQRGRRRVSKRRQTVEMPPIGWLILREALAPDVYGANGGFTGPLRMRTALQKIATELNELARHPAMFDRPVPGYYPGEVLGFLVPPGDSGAQVLIGSREAERVFSPYPVEDGVAHRLTPRHFTQQGFEMTAWRSESVSHDSEELRQHLVFRCEVHRGRVHYLDGA